VAFDEHGIGGDGEYFGDNDAHLDPINVFYHEASGGKDAPRAVLFDLEPGMTGTVRASSLCCLFRPGIPVRKTGPKTTTKELSTISSAPPLLLQNFSSPHLISFRVLTRAQRTRINFYPQQFASVPLGFVLNRVFSGF
jgi:hypothetical protein